MSIYYVKQNLSTGLTLLNYFSLNTSFETINSPRIAIPFVFGSLAIGDSVALIFSDLSTSKAIKYVVPILSLSALFKGISIIYN